MAKGLIDKCKAKVSKALDSLEGKVFNSREDADDAITLIIESIGPMPLSIQANHKKVVVKEKWGKREGRLRIGCRTISIIFS